jgi:hypothetical protein
MWIENKEVFKLYIVLLKFMNSPRHSCHPSIDNNTLYKIIHFINTFQQSTQSRASWKQIKKAKKKAKNKNPKRLQVNKNIQEKTKAANSDLVECEQCGLTFKTKGIKRHKTVKHKTTTTKLTRQFKIFFPIYLFLYLLSTKMINKM